MFKNQTKVGGREIPCSQVTERNIPQYPRQQKLSHWEIQLREYCLSQQVRSLANHMRPTEESPEQISVLKKTRLKNALNLVKISKALNKFY